MKHFKILLLFIIISISINTISGQIKTICFPYCESYNSEHTSFDKIVFSDNETVLHTNVYHSPNYWVKIPSGCYLRGKSGKKYTLLKADGFRLDEEVFMPESGTMSFTLHFEAVDPSEETLDFIKYDGKTPEVTGIRTSKDFYSDKPICCKISGEVIDRPQSHLLYLTKKGGDIRVNKKIIPIKNGRFEFEIYSDYEEAYELTFADEHRKGSWRPAMFFVWNGPVEMKLYDMDNHKNNIINGNEDNREYHSLIQKVYSEIMDSYFDQITYLLENYEKYNTRNVSGEIIAFIEVNNNKDTADIRAKLDKLWNEDLYMNDEAKSLLKAAKETDDTEEEQMYYRQFYSLQDSRQHLSDEARELEDKINKVTSLALRWEMDYLEKNISLATYLRLLEKIKFSVSGNAHYGHENEKTDEYIDLFNRIYADKFPGHPYTKEIKDFIDNHRLIRLGGKYIDFTAPDFEGNQVTLSEKIEGKIALIDLWASWCGPCRRLSKSMIPVYENFKNKGFTIVGIAREEREEDAKNAATKDNYPWLNLLEIKDQIGIWKKYGVGNAGGATFLVDKDGTILALKPTAEEVTKILEEKLKQDE